LTTTSRRAIGVAGSAMLAAAGFGCVSLLVGLDRVGPFDSAIIAAVQSTESAGLTRLAEALSLLGSTGPVIALALLIAVVLFVKLGHRLELMLFAAALGGAAVWNRLLKAAFQRPRPDIHPLVAETGYSFPSGHTMAAFALYGAVLYLFWRHVPGKAGRSALIAACALPAAGIAVSRIYLGVHYPSDILGGLLAGGAWLGLCVCVYKRRSGQRNGHSSEQREAA